MSEDTRQLLEVTGLSSAFDTEAGELVAVDGVDFKVDRGKTLGIVGESGCGKSVTNLSILGIIDFAILLRRLSAGRRLARLHAATVIQLRTAAIETK